MKLLIHLSLAMSLLTCTNASAQPNAPKLMGRILSIEPGAGIHTNFGTDLLLSNLVQWNVTTHFTLAGYTAFSFNNIFQRNFNYVKTEYNYSINQKFGFGATFYSIKNSHTFMFMAGAKYTEFKETLDNPNLDRVNVSIASLSPDYGLMYSFKKGGNKYFFTSRIYVPLSPWLTKGAKVENLQGTFRDVALELGIGIKIK